MTADNWQPQVPASQTNGGPIENGPDGRKGSENKRHGGARKKLVVVGLGMVGISFM
jgi:nitrite reductase (NAD(P)H)